MSRAARPDRRGLRSRAKPFLDYYRPALLTSPLYHADGQQRDEVYNWGSFLQSKMYANGVTCSDCHDPHSGKLRAEGNVLCATCHLPSKYDTAAHHHHKSASAGAACVACHMPTTTYMVVDPRHDHSLRVPRPDLSVKFGTPNACNGCHTNRDARWAAAQVNTMVWARSAGLSTLCSGVCRRQWRTRWMRKRNCARSPTIRRSLPSHAPRHLRINAQLTETARRSCRGLAGSEFRWFGSRHCSHLPTRRPNARVRLAAPLLADPLKAVRIEAASLLAAVPAEQLSAEQRAAFERAAREYIDTQRYNADRADARVNLGTFYANRGDAARAEEEIKAAIRLEPFFIPAYVNLADLYRARGRDAEGERFCATGSR